MAKASSRIPKSRKIALSALLIASSIVLSRFLAIRTSIIAINFTFVPIMFSGMLLGWKSATFIAVVADVIGALLFPSGSFFLGYTLTAALSGWLAGVCLYRPTGIKLDRNFVLRLLTYVILSTILLHGLLNTLWIFITTGGASNIIVPVRIAKQLLMAPVELITMTMLVKLFDRRLNLLVAPRLATIDEE